MVPVGPIHQTDRRQLAEGVQRKDSFSGDGDKGEASSGHYSGGTEFEGPPKGLVLPKEVEPLLL